MDAASDIPREDWTALSLVLFILLHKQSNHLKQEGGKEDKEDKQRLSRKLETGFPWVEAAAYVSKEPCQLWLQIEGDIYFGLAWGIHISCLTRLVDSSSRRTLR